MIQTFAKEFKPKRQAANSWSGPIARELVDGMLAWVVAGAILLAWLGFRLGSTRLAHVAFTIARSALPRDWRDQFSDWPEWCEHARELLEDQEE